MITAKRSLITPIKLSRMTNNTTPVSFPRSSIWPFTMMYSKCPCELCLPSWQLPFLLTACHMCFFVNGCGFKCIQNIPGIFLFLCELSFPLSRHQVTDRGRGQTEISSPPTLGLNSLILRIKVLKEDMLRHFSPPNYAVLNWKGKETSQVEKHQKGNNKPKKKQGFLPLRMIKTDTEQPTCKNRSVFFSFFSGYAVSDVVPFRVN